MTSWGAQNQWGRVNDRYQQLAERYASVNVSRDVICEMFRPDLMPETDEGLRGVLKGANIYEGTPAWAARMMATGFQGNLVSQSIDWVKYEFEQLNLKYIDALDGFTQDVKDHMTMVYSKSTFYDRQPQFTLDGVTIGSPVMFLEEDENLLSGKIFCLPQHYKHCYISHDKNGEENGIIIKDPTWTAKQIYDKFGGGSIEKAKERLSNQVYSSLQSGQYNDEYTIWRAVFKKDDGIWDGEGDNSFKKPPGDYKWLSIYFDDAPTQPNGLNKPLKIGDKESEIYFEKPYVVWDYDRKFYEPSSRTPAFNAIFDAESNNEVFGDYLELCRLKVRPPVWMLDTMKGRAKFTPEAEMYVTSQEYKEPPVKMDVTGDIQFNQQLSEILFEKCKRWFYLDQLQLWSDLIRDVKQHINNPMIWQIAGEKATLLSPAIESHQRYLKEVDERMMGIERRAGRGPFNPQNMANIKDIILSQAKGRIDGVNLIPKFVGPLARAQRAQQKLEPIRAGLEFVASAAQAMGDPAYAGMIVKPYEVFDDGLLAVDFPAKNIVSKEVFNNSLQNLNQQRMQQKQLDNAVEIAKASKGQNKAIEPNSPMALMAGQGAQGG